MADGNSLLIVSEDLPEDLEPFSADKPKRKYPQLARGKQKSFHLSGRINRYVESRSLRHEVPQAEVVRTMLNERIDHEEMLEKAYRNAVADNLIEK